MSTQRGVTYNHETVVLDGASFANCAFEACRLVYAGGAPPALDSCRFVGCEWLFEDAAADTLACLKAMWSAGLKPEVQTMIKDITAAAR